MIRRNLPIFREIFLTKKTSPNNQRLTRRKEKRVAEFPASNDVPIQTNKEELKELAVDLVTGNLDNETVISNSID